MMTHIKYGEMWDTACALYDGGWRASDRGDLAEEYGFTPEELDVLCDALAEIETDNADR